MTASVDRAIRLGSEAWYVAGEIERAEHPDD
jgi:hypothetical protein